MPQIGLKNIYVAKILTETEEGITYDEPRKVSQAITANVTPNFTVTTLYADDQAAEVEEALGDIDVEIGIKDLDSDDYCYILGRTKNADGVIEDSVDDVTPYVAIGWEIPLSKGNGVRLYWYYKGKFGVPGGSSTTKQGQVEYQTPTVSGKFMAREDGKWRARLDSKDDDANEAVAAGWFNQVYAPTGELTTITE